MRLTIEQFRLVFPAFTEDLYPDEAVNFRLILADKFFSEELWIDSDVRDHAMGLFTAHYLSAYGSKDAGGSGSGGGSGMGTVTSKSVDGASISYDTTSGAWQDAGFWNTTPYGRELWYLMSIFGAGAVQI